MEIISTGKKARRSTNSSKEITLFVISMMCMFLFLFSAYEKIIDHERFFDGLSKVDIIGSQAMLISWSIPILEVGISILLIIPQTQRKGLIGFLTLMIVFTFYVSYMWFWADNLPCHCNLIIDKLTWGEHIWFNLIFVGLASIALLFSNSNLKS